MLRERGVVGKFVEFYGPGAADTLPRRPGDDRQHVAGVRLDLRDLPDRRRDPPLPRFTGRPTEEIELVEAYAREQGLFHEPEAEEPTFSETLELDLGDVVPAIAGPKRPQDRIALSDARTSSARRSRSYDDRAAGELGTSPIRGVVPGIRSARQRQRRPRPARRRPAEWHRRDGGRRGAAAPTTRSRSSDADGNKFELDHGRVVIAAITSCTNTSNPSVMIGAGLLAKKAVERGPGDQAVGEDLAGAGLEGRHRVPREAGLDRYLDELGFDLVGYGCTTCIGNSGPLPDEISAAINDHDLVVCACCRATATSRAASSRT